MLYYLSCLRLSNVKINKNSFFICTILSYKYTNDTTTHYLSDFEQVTYISLANLKKLEIYLLKLLNYRVDPGENYLKKLLFYLIKTNI